MKCIRYVCISLCFCFATCKTNVIDKYVGTYEKKPSVYTLDSLYILKENAQISDVVGRHLHKYTQRIFNKKSNRLIFENHDVWWTQDGKIVLNNFYWESNEPEDTMLKSIEERKSNHYVFTSSLDGENLIVDKDCNFKKIVTSR